MLDNETSKKLLTTVMEQINDLYPEKSGTQKLAHQIANIAAMVSITVLQEYEKLNQ